MLSTSSSRQKIFREALARESSKTKKGIDRKKMFRSNFPYGVVILWSLFLLVGGYILLFSSWVMVTQVVIETPGRVTANEIREQIEPILRSKRFLVFPAGNFFLIPKREIESTLLEKYPLLSSVGMKRSFPDTLTVILQEHPHLLLWCAAGPCAMLDADGRTLFREKALDTKYDPWRFRVVDTSALPLKAGEELPVKEYLEYFVLLRERLTKSLDLTVMNEATTPSRFSRELRISTTDGWALLVNIDSPVEETFLSVEAFLKERAVSTNQTPLLTIDVRVPGRIFFTEATPVIEEVKDELKSKNP